MVKPPPPKFEGGRVFARRTGSTPRLFESIRWTSTRFSNGATLRSAATSPTATTSTASSWPIRGTAHAPRACLSKACHARVLCCS